MLTRTARRYVIASSIVVFLLVLYTVAGFWAVPHFLRSGATDFVSTHYGRKVTLGDIRFNPYTFTLDITDFSLPDSDGQPMLGFGRLHVDLEAVSLFKLGPTFREIVLERPLVRAVIRHDGDLNLADLGKGFAGSPAPPPTQKPSPPARVFIDRFAVIAGNGTFEDLSHATPFHTEFKPIAFELRNFSTRAKPDSPNDNEYTLTAASPEGERLEWKGSFLLAPLSAHGTFAITDLHASTIWTYLQEPLPMEIPSGTVAVKGEYHFDDSGEAPVIKVNVHDTTVADLRLRPRQGTTDYVVLGKLDVQETQVDVAKRAVEIGKVSLAGGEVNAWLSAQGKLNLLELAGSGGAASAQASSATPGAITAQGASPVSGAPPGATTAQGASLPSGATPGHGSPVQSAQASGSPAPAAATGAQTAPVWTVSVPDISVSGFKVSAEDRQVSPALALTLSPIDIHVAGYNTTPAARLDITAKTTINGSSTLNATAQLSPGGGGDTTAHIDLAQLDLAMFQPFVAQRTAMTLQSGKLTTQLDIKKTADGALSAKGDVDVIGLRTVDELQQSFIKWKDLKVAGIQYDSQPALLQITTVTAQGAYARVIIAPDRTVNVAQVLAGPSKGTPGLATQLGAANAKAGGVTVAGVKGGPPDQAAALSADIKAAKKDAKAEQQDAKSAQKATKGAAGGGTAVAAGGGATVASSQSSAPAMPMSIGTIRIVDGSANYADFWIQPNFALGIQTLNGTITGLSSDPKSRAKVKLEGKVDRYAPVTISGELNVLAASIYTDIDMSFKGLELTTITPYSGRFAGYKIDKGKLSVDLSYKIDQRKLNAEQHIVIDQLQLGDAVDSPDAVHLPLKLAVALLKDRNGVIDLPLPITGSLDDPQFKVGPIIWHAVLNLLEKAVTAPFAAIGRLFGGHGEELKYIDFAAGSADLDDTSKEKLSSLTKALEEHNQLQLDVPIVYSQDLDGPVLAKRILNQRLILRAHGGKMPAQLAAANAQAANAAPASGKSPSAHQAAGSAQAASGQQAAGSASAAPGQQAAGSASAASGQQAADQQTPATPPAPTDPALADPLQHYRLLLAEFQAESGKDAELPASAAAIQNAKSKKDAPPVESAIPDLENAIIAQIDVPELQLQALGKNRTRAIQDALLTDGGIDASRVFIINGTAKTDDNGKVRVEMALK